MLFKLELVSVHISLKEMHQATLIIIKNKLFVSKVCPSEATGSNLGRGASCWKVGSYLPMPGGLQCNMHWFPPPVNYPSQYDPGC